jgi:hypothetical protein
MGFNSAFKWLKYTCYYISYSNTLLKVRPLIKEILYINLHKFHLEENCAKFVTNHKVSFVGPVAQSVQRLATGWAVRGSNHGGGQDFPHLSTPALGPTQPPVQWVPGLFQGVNSGRGVMLTPHPPLLVPLVMKE